MPNFEYAEKYFKTEQEKPKLKKKIYYRIIPLMDNSHFFNQWLIIDFFEHIEYVNYIKQ